VTSGLGRSSGEVLRAARQRDSQDKRARVLEVVGHMVGGGEAVTFAAVARTAKVSRWLVYADGVREHIVAARQQQAEQPGKSRTAAAAGLQTEVAVVRESHARLRKENERLKDGLRRQLGHQLDQIHAPELVARISELTAQAQDATATIKQLRQDNEALSSRLGQAEEDLLAARASLRRMIRSHNAGNESADRRGPDASGQ
jgi:chromosome segregation ATPase